MWFVCTDLPLIYNSALDLNNFNKSFTIIFVLKLLCFQESISSQMFENFTGKWTFSVQQFFWGQQTISKVAITKTKSATIAFSFFHLFFSFVDCDFGAYRAQKTCLLTPFTQIIAMSVWKNRLDIQFKHQWKAAFHRDKYRSLKCACLYE